MVQSGRDRLLPDFQRNPAYGAGGAPVITQYDFSGDGVNATTAGGEAFLDASSIAAQGNTAYNLAQFVAAPQAARLPASGCWIKIVGAAPGASVMALKVFAENDDTTESGFLQAIQYAVQHGVKVINQSFGATNFPDTVQDVTRAADDAAVAAGVTVVVSTGDAGNTSTIGSPSSDPNVISVGGTTTFRSYAQDNFGGFYNPSVGNGRWVDNNISSLSSGGFTQAGNTIDLVAPGDLNWALCSTSIGSYYECTSDTGAPSPIQLSGGTSESSPLTAAAAADVIQAYTQAHGANPSPALVKQILMSTATDIGAPAAEQGAGLINIQAAVKLAASLPGARTGPPAGSILVSPGQVNFVASPNTPQSQQISVTNPGSVPAFVGLSTRALTDKVADTGLQTFNLDPGNPTSNTGTMQIWSGVTEVYQTETFIVPRTHPWTTSRLLFSADYQYTGQTSLPHIALFEPDGTYAGYTLPQGLGNFEEAEVANPPAGTWTAVIFTGQTTTTGIVGTSGPVQWDASTWEFDRGGSINPPFLVIPPGRTATATLRLTTPSAAGDTAQSIVISSLGGQTTVPVTVRSTIPVDPISGGTFSGMLTGGNGRSGVQAQSNSYTFTVPAGKTDMDVSVALASDPCQELIAYLVDPHGQTVGYSSNFTYGLTTTSCPNTPGTAGEATRYAQLYHLAPEPGQWSLLLYWANPVSGNELQEQFTGSIKFNQVRVSSTLPTSAATTVPLAGGPYKVNVKNTGVAPEAFFVDARLYGQTATVPLPNWNPSVTAGNFQIPLPPGAYYPYYLVPTHTTQLQANLSRLSGSQPVTFDLQYFPGDPDVSPNQAAPGVANTSSADGSSAGLTLAETPEVSPGLWLLNPAEFGPYPSGGATPEYASANLSAVTEAFDPAVTSGTDNFWKLGFAAGNFLLLLPGQTGTINVQVKPTASPGAVVSGTLYVDDITLAAFSTYNALPNGDELAAIPYQYTVGS